MNGFLEKYINQLIKYCKIPKFQNERALSMMLSLYIEEIIFKITGEKFAFLTVELPIAENKSFRSTNIDYCLINDKRNLVLLVELKTEKQGANKHFKDQLKGYKELKDVKYLKENLKRSITAKRGKKHQRKYDVLKNQIGDYIFKADSVEIMYIAPDCIVNEELKNSQADFIKDEYKVSFSQILKIDIDDDFQIIKKYLAALNTSLAEGN